MRRLTGMSPLAPAAAASVQDGLYSFVNFDDSG